jgi:hypothetical protein
LSVDIVSGIFAAGKPGTGHRKCVPLKKVFTTKGYKSQAGRTKVQK